MLHAATLTAPDGTSYFTVAATDGTDTVLIPCSVTVYPALDLTMFQKFLFIVGTTASYRIEATAGLPPYRFRYSDPTDPFLHGAKLFPDGTVTATAEEKFFQSRDIIVVDALGAIDDAFVQLEFRDPNPKIQPSKNGAEVGGPGPEAIDFVEGENIALEVDNDGTTVTVRPSIKRPRMNAFADSSGAVWLGLAWPDDDDF